MEEVKKCERPPDLSFEPVKKGGANFTVARLKTQPDGSLIFCPTFLNWFVSSIFILLTIPFLIPFFTLRAMPEPGARLFLIFILLIFWAVGIFLLRLLLLKPRFDFERRAYYRSITTPRYGDTGENKKDYTPFSQITGLQLLTEECRGSKGSSFLSHELNLVLEDGKRINVVDHGGWENIKNDAEELAEKLDLPLWLENDETREMRAVLYKDVNRKGNKLAGWIFLGMGGVFFFFAGIMPFVKYLRSLSWEQKEARVLTSYLDSRISRSNKGRSSTVYCVKVKYTYTHKGKSYTSNRYKYPETYNNYDVRGKRKLLRQYPPGKKIICYVNSADPKEAAIQRKFLTFDIGFGSVISLVFMIVGGVLILKGKRKEILTTPS